jgi:hypothetical protein
MKNIDTVAYFTAKQNLNKYLNENPHLRPLQKQIDALMKHAGSDHNRMALLTQLITKNVADLQAAFKDLKTSLDKWTI